MGDAQRWIVTYTKHVKQKRKAYQDGILELQCSRHKVVLYDEGDKLLESRFVKKDDVIKSGETLAFDCYLVDIGEPCEGHIPMSTLPCQEKDRKVTEKPQFSHSYHFQKRKPTFRNKGRVINLSPSEKVIREFRSNNMNKYGASPSYMDANRSNITEWEVLYTTQITQKAKKFHDGFLQLVGQGSLGRQVMLYDVSRRLLASRFLKKHESVLSGESLAFEGHLVEIGEKGNEKAVTDITHQRKEFQVVGKTQAISNLAKIPTNKVFPPGMSLFPSDRDLHLRDTFLGKLQTKAPEGNLSTVMVQAARVQNAHMSVGTPTNEPRRAVHEIMSFIRKPIPLNDENMKETFVVEHLQSHSEGCNGTEQEEPRERNSDHGFTNEVVEPETVEPLVAADKFKVSENGGECQAGYSNFHVRSGTTHNMIPTILCEEFTNQHKMVSTSTSVEPHSLATFLLDSENQKPTEPNTLTRPNENLEPEKPPEMYSCQELMTETKGVAGLSSGKLPKEHTNRMDKFPSFDLGF